MWFWNSILKIILFLSLIFSAVPPNIPPTELRVMVVGDIIMHSPIISAGYDPNIKGYNYEDIFTQVQPIFAQADLVIGNLEGPLGGADLGYSGYPRFNAPKELAAALKIAGVDVLTTANNHSMDQWEKGLTKTLDHLDEYEIKHTGTFRTEEEKATPLIIEVNEIKIGIIANTYGTNGLPVPEDKPYMVNLLDLDTIREEVVRLQENNVDYIMAMIHYGPEYIRLPSAEQLEWTDQLLDLGVDFVLGSHPHVVQPLRIITGDENQSDQGVIYSLGNFLSNQQWDWKDYGIILDLTLEKDHNKQTIKLKNITVIPTYVQISSVNGQRKYQVLPIIEENKESIAQEIWSNGQELVEFVFNAK